MKISLIVPIYNESKTINNFIKQLDNLPGDWEIIFADGGSTDDTLVQIGTEYRVVNCPKGRAKQMNTAAGVASGEVLWFVHCDSLLPTDAYEQIVAACAGGAVFGCFHISFDYDGFFMGYNTYMSNRRAKKSHIAFGDQGIFISRELFMGQGGFPDLPIMEDYEFSRRMKRQKIPLNVVPAQIITSGRRYRNAHPLRTMLRMVWLRWLYRCGTDIEVIAKKYRDIR